MIIKKLKRLEVSVPILKTGPHTAFRMFEMEKAIQALADHLFVTALKMLMATKRVKITPQMAKAHPGGVVNR